MMKGRNYGDWEPFIAMTKVYNRGKTQIPVEIRRALKIHDGDKVIWIKIGNHYGIEKK